MNTTNKSLRWGSTILAVSALFIMAAPIVILSRQPDLATRTGRHVWAGALGLASLAILESLIALVPLRRGEKWAFWAALIPYAIVGFPVLVIDAVHVPMENLVNTLAPQIFGLAVGTIGLFFSARGVFSKRGLQGAAPGRPSQRHPEADSG